MIVSGNSAFELEWFKNAVDISESERISLVKHEGGRFTLNIQDCEDDDTGEYCCVAQNEAGRVTCAGWLTVEGNINWDGIVALRLSLLRPKFEISFPWNISVIIIYKMLSWEETWRSLFPPEVQKETKLKIDLLFRHRGQDQGKI